MKRGYKSNREIVLYCFLTIFACLLTNNPVFADPPTVSILSPSEGKKIYTTATNDYPVKIVFKTWDQKDGIKTSEANSFVLFWWKGVSSGSIDITGSTQLHSWGPNDTATDIYRSYDWVPTDGSGVYTIQIQSTDNAGVPSKGKSRKVDITVSITTLNNFSGFPGDGKLLVRDNDNTICLSCHGLKSHSSADIGSTKYGNWERVCRDCHTPHNTRNIFLLQSSFKIYTGATDQSFAYRKKVDFRNISGESTFGFVSKSGKERRGPCEVCHTRTRNTNNTPRWRNYTSEPDVDGKKHNAGTACINCHFHKDGFKPGESKGNLNCNGCHPDLFAPMNEVNDGYHHYMNNSDVTSLASGNKYPVINPPTPLNGLSDQNRRCLMCHVDHDIFRKDINPDSTSRAYNLRPNISTEPTSTSGVNTDYLASDSYGGICLSCHQNSQNKSYPQPDGTTNTPIINKTLFSGSPHNYEAPATFNSGATQFMANCSKCHIDTINKTKQVAGTQLGPHYSVVRKINAVTTSGNNIGTVSAGGPSILTDDDDTISWDIGVWTGRTVKILEGVGAGQSRYITGNDEQTLNISPDWTTEPVFGDVYLIGISREIDHGLSTGGNDTLTIHDNSKAWINDLWVDRPVTIIKGTGYGQTRQVKFNSLTTLTIDAANPWDVVPDATSKYSIGDPSEEEVCFRCHSEQTNPFASDQKDFFGVKTFENPKVLKMEELFYSQGELRKVTASTTTTVTDGTASWDVNQWAGQEVKIVSGKGSGQVRTVVSNTTNTLTIFDPWETGFTPSPTSQNTRSMFFVGAGNPFRHRMEKYFAKHRSDEAETAPDGLTETGWINDAGVSNGLHSGCQDCHNPHGNRKGGDDNGTAESGTGISLVDHDKSWSKDDWRGYTLRLMNGTGRGQDRMVVFNTATSLIVGATFDTAPAAGTYYVLVPNGLPEKGNNLWNPNSGAWGVNVSYSPVMPPVNSMAGPAFTKNKDLVGGTDKVYQLCFKCHSQYAWGTLGTPFTIPDSLNTAINYFKEGPTTNIAQEFNPNNLGYHPLIDVGANQPIIAMGDMPVNLTAKLTATGNATNKSSILYENMWSANKYSGQCVEMTSGSVIGEIRTIMGHTGSTLSVDPAFSNNPTMGSTFYIRKCSIYNVGANYNASSTPWPRFTGGTITLTAGSDTATINGLTNGIPSTVINGWYIYAGSLRDGPYYKDTPKGGACSPTAPCPPMMSTSGWYQVKYIYPGASDASTSSATLTISPAPANSYSGTYALSAGLGNTFVPPYGPWSVIACPDCHDTDDSRYPSGPHASSRQWILKTLEAQSFPWFVGGLNSSTPTSDASLVKKVSYPDGTSTAWHDSRYMYMKNYTCLNCHRSDVYGSEGLSPMNDNEPTGAGFENYTYRYMSRLPHLPSGGNWFGGSGETNSYGISCMNCHGGDNRVSPDDDPSMALGGIHGSNLGNSEWKSGLITWGGAEITDWGSSMRGRRLLNGAAWKGVTRASTSKGVTCVYPKNDTVSNCVVNNYGTGQKAVYPYFSGSDPVGTLLDSAMASNVAGGYNGVQSGDKVVLMFSAETNGDLIDANNINTALKLSGNHVWTNGAGSLGGTGKGEWTSTNYLNDTLTITLSGSGGIPSILAGDTITPDGTITGADGAGIRNTVVIDGTFGVSPVSAMASDPLGNGPGIQAGDQVVITFDSQTNGAASGLSSLNINSALDLGGNSWLDGDSLVNIGWSSTLFANDTLTITLSTGSGTPTVSILDTINLDGITIKDSQGSPITGSLLLVGSFDSVPAGAVGYWKFEETSGSITYDETTYDNRGGLIDATRIVSARRGRGVSFGGGDLGHRIEVADDNSLDLTTSGSIEFWARKNVDENYQYYVSKDGAFYVSSDSTGKLSFNWNGTTLTTSQALPVGTWYHTVCTFDGSNMRIYIDGKLAAGPISASAATANGNPLYVGSYSPTLYTVNGDMDEVVIYNTSLSLAQVRERYGAWPKNAGASDSSGLGSGIQQGDQVVITFDGATDGLAGIDKATINSALALNNGHTWLDGASLDIYSSAWSTVSYPNDTLTVTLNNMTTSLAVANGDTITLDGSIKDAQGRSILDSIIITGDFDIPYGSVGYWKFDEGYGSVTGDSTLYNNNGTITGGNWTNMSYRKAAFDFSTTVAGINVADSASLDLTAAGSIEVWAKKNSNSNDQVLLAKGTTNAYQLKELGTTGKITARWGQGVIDNYSTSQALLTNAWNHIILTYDGSNLLYYVNGQAAGGGSYTTDAVANTSELWIGHRNGSLHYDGILDEVVIYDKALSLSEVQSRFKVRLDSASANAVDYTPGIQAGDQVVIRFKSPTAGGTSFCTTANIGSALALNGGSWGTMSAGQCAWTSNPHSNDTLTITLAADATVGIGDTITLGGGILDALGRPVTDTIQLDGSFGTAAGNPSGAVAYWKLDQTTGAVIDETANNNDGSVSGGLTRGVAGRYGNAFDFVPVSEVTVPDSNSLDLTKEATIEAWVNRDSNKKDQVYISKGSAFSFRDYSTTGKIAFDWAGSANTLVSNSVAATGVWNHVVVTYDGKSINMYLNGKLDNSLAPYVADSEANSSVLRIGSDGVNDFDGKIDEVVLYNRALSQTEILARYGAWLTRAFAVDASFEGQGIQAGDELIISFDGSTNGDTIADIGTALVLGSGSWGSTSTYVWTADGGKPYDTLIITLAADADITPGTTITLGGTIKDTLLRPVIDSIAISGSFGVPPNVVGYWKFDQNGNDESTYNNDGTVYVNTAPAYTNKSYDGYALNLVGSNIGSAVQVSANDTNPLSLTTKGSLEFWARKNTDKNNQSYISKGISNAYQLIDYGTTGKLALRWGNNTDDLISNTVLPVGSWNHVVATYDGAALTFYINGEFDNSVPYSTDAVATNDNLWIGRNMSSYYVDGIMDEVLIYDRALTPSEVKKRFKVKLESAEALAVDTTPGIQTGDQIVIRFRNATKGNVIDSGNIASALVLNSGSWGTFNNAVWSDDPNIPGTYDTLTITLSGDATLAAGDTITLGGIIEDALGIGRAIEGSIQIGGSFGTVLNGPEGAVAYWKLENNGTDETVHNNDGTVNGGAWITGRFGQALDLEEASFDNISVPDDNSLDLTTEGSLELWIKKESNTYNQPYITKGSAYKLFTNGFGNKVAFKWGTKQLTSNADLALGEWYHIVAVYNGSDLLLYINGEFDNSTPCIVDGIANSAGLLIGIDDGAYPFDGIMDEIVIYNRAVSPEEIRQRYGSWLQLAEANDTSGGGAGIQLNDEVVLSFSGKTNGEPVNSGNIASALGLNSGSWGTFNSADWTFTNYTNDTLTIKLSADATVGVGDTITLGGNIKDTIGRAATGSIQISGTFGTAANEPAGAVGHWKFDEYTGGSFGILASDATINNNDGTVQNSTSWIDPGKYGTAVTFDGSTDYVTIADSNSLDLTTQGSVEMWINIANHVNGQVFISKGESDSFGMRGYGSGATADVDFWWGSNFANRLVSLNSNLSTNTWYHIVGTYDGSTLKVYVNGQLKDSKSGSLDSSVNGNDLVIGASTTLTNKFSGMIDEVVLYNKVLELPDVQARYAAQLSSAVASDNTIAGIGKQSGDQVIITFSGATKGNAIDAANINSALALNNSHSWLDGENGLGTPAPTWSTTDNTYDTLKVTLRSYSGLPSISIGDTITLDGTIKDSLNRGILGTIAITGEYDIPVDAIAYWRYDDSGTNVTDFTGNGYNGVAFDGGLPGAVWTTGKVGSGLTFDGSNDYVNYTPNAAFALTSSYAIEAWIKPTQFVDDGAIFFNGDSGAFRYNFSVYADGKLGLSYNSSGLFSGRTIAKSTGSLSLDEWNHVVVTRNGVKGTPNGATFYINGIASGTFTDSHYDTTSGALWSGRSDISGGNNYFKGDIDELIVFNRSLTAEEVKIRHRTWMEKARASDFSGGGFGIQTNDKLVIAFDGGTNAPDINSANIGTALVLNNGHSWLPDGGVLGGSGSGEWSSVSYPNDTLTITFNNTTGTLAVLPGDIITLDNTIVDSMSRPSLGDSIIISGTFSTVPSGATAFWKFDEALSSGSIVVDATNNENHGVLYSGVTRTSSAHEGNALLFDGANDYAAIKVPNLNLTNYMRIDFRIKASGQDPGDGIITSDAFEINVSSGKLQTRINTGTQWLGCVIGGDTIFDNNWHHVVLSWDASNLNLVVDGSPAGSCAAAAASLATPTIIRFGSPLAGVNYFSGTLDEIVIFNQP